MTRKFVRRRLRLLPHRLSRYLISLSLSVILLSTLTGFLFSQGSPQPSLAYVVPSPVPTTIPTPTTQLQLPTTNPPDISAKNVLILDIQAGLVLYQEAADELVYPASTTKLMTALVVLDTYSLDQVLTVGSDFIPGQNVGFIPGEKISVEKLLYALLVQSGNDAAEILAANFPGGRSGFIAAMNSTANRLNLLHTQFQNPTGLDQDGQYSTASDLARLSLAALKNDLIKRIVATQNSVITSNDQTQFHILTNTNQLLGKVPGVLGLKTGFTDKAGESLITYVDRPDRSLVFVVLRSTDRFADTKTLINWIYSQTP